MLYFSYCLTQDAADEGGVQGDRGDEELWRKVQGKFGEREECGFLRTLIYSRVMSFGNNLLFIFFSLIRCLYTLKCIAILLIHFPIIQSNSHLFWK